MAEEASQRRVTKPAPSRRAAARGGRAATKRAGGPARMVADDQPDGQNDAAEGISALSGSRRHQRASDAPVPAVTRRKRRDPDSGLHTMDGKPATRKRRVAIPDDLLEEEAEEPAPDAEDVEDAPESSETPSDDDDFIVEVPDTVEGAEDGEDPGDDAFAAKKEELKLQRRVLDPTQLYRGRARMALMRDLAMGEWSHEAIAKSVGVHPEFIRDFSETYAEDIADVRSALQGQVAIESGGLWISKRVNRIAELQGDYEDIDLVVEQMRQNWRNHDEDDKNMVIGSRRHQALLRAKLSILKAVSDELAPSKAKQDEEMDKNTVRYVIEQDDGDDIIEALT